MKSNENILHIKELDRIEQKEVIKLEEPQQLGDGSAVSLGALKQVYNPRLEKGKRYLMANARLIGENDEFLDKLKESKYYKEVLAQEVTGFYKKVYYPVVSLTTEGIEAFANKESREVFAVLAGIGEVQKALTNKQRKARTRNKIGRKTRKMNGRKR